MERKRPKSPMYAPTSDNANLYEKHNPGRPLWLIVLCKVIGALNTLLCEEKNDS